jgi:hypothetical protein
VKTIWITLGAVPLTAGLMLAQDSSGGGQSWHGLLVAAACQSGGSDMNRTTSDMNKSSDTNKSSDMKRNTPRSATAGREQSTTYEQTANQADRSATTSTPMARNTANTDQSSSMNQTRDLNRATPRNTGDTSSMANSATQDDSLKRNTAKNNSTGDDMDRDRATVAGLDNSCRISSQTTAFALRLEDGRVVRFDDASNSKIASQLQSGDRLAHKTKVFRANVRGSMQGDTISADTVEM